jgi:hypothetical protein
MTLRQVLEELWKDDEVRSPLSPTVWLHEVRGKQAAHGHRVAKYGQEYFYMPGKMKRTRIRKQRGNYKYDRTI